MYLNGREEASQAYDEGSIPFTRSIPTPRAPRSVGRQEAPSRKDASLPITLIVVGLVWLAAHFHFFPDIDWVIGIGSIAGGVAVLVIDGINKHSIVTGPLLIAIGAAWLLHDQYRISWSVMIPLVLIMLGVLMLVARSPRIPERQRPAPKAN